MLYCARSAPQLQPCTHITQNCRCLPSLKIPRRRHGRRSTSSIVRVHNEALALHHQRSSMDKRSVDRAVGHANGAGVAALPSVKG
jgi:hypothetical protein